MIFKNIILFACILIVNNVTAQYKDLNLSFESLNSKDFRWQYSSEYQNILYFDTVNVKDGKQSLKIIDASALDIMPLPNFLASVFQYIKLPDSANNIDLSVYSKSKQVDGAWIKLYGLDENGELVSRDSVSIISPLNWNKFQLNIQTTTANSIYLEIFFHTKHSIKSSEFTKEKEVPQLWIDNIQIKVNGQDISSYHESEFYICAIDREEICNHVKLNSNLLEIIDSIPDFKNHRILAFGETTHTSREIQQFVFNSTKVLIERNNCKLFLMEIPFEIGLRLNEYVGGKTDESIEELLFFNLINSNEFISFLNWIRDYNSKNNSKVTIIGIDTGHFLSELDRHLFRLIENHTPKSKIFETFADFLSRNKYNDALTVINNHGDTLINELGNELFLEIKHALEIRNGQLNPDHDMADSYRDYLMYQNSKWAIDNYLKQGDQAVLYAHLGHVNKGNAFFCRFDVNSMGRYMNRNYGRDYFTTVVTVGTGTIADPKKMKSDVGYSLSVNIHGSIEELCMSSDDRLFYKNLASVGSTYFVRGIGSGIPPKEFYPFNHKDRVDGVVFIRESTSYRRPDDWPKDLDDWFRYLDKKIKKQRATQVDK